MCIATIKHDALLSGRANGSMTPFTLLRPLGRLHQHHARAELRKETPCETYPGTAPEFDHHRGIEQRLPISIAFFTVENFLAMHVWKFHFFNQTTGLQR
jgi:hypothetical protein